MADATPLSITRSANHACTSVIPGSQFKKLAPGHWAAVVSHSAGPTAEHSTGRSPLFGQCKDGYNTTTIKHLKVNGTDHATVGVSFFTTNPDGSMEPVPTHPGSEDARVHVTDKHGLTYQAVIPAGSNEPETIHWDNHEYTAENVAKINAIAPLDEPFRDPQIFEAEDAKSGGPVYYRVNDSEPCVAQRLFAQNPAEKAKIKTTSISGSGDMDGQYFEVHPSLHREVQGHIEGLKKAHGILSKSSASPGMAVHVLGMKERPDAVHVHVVHSTTPLSGLPKTPPKPDMFTINAEGGLETPSSKSLTLKPIGGSAGGGEAGAGS